MDKWTTRRAAARSELTTYPQPLLRRRCPGRRFAHQGGSIFDYQVGPFSMITALPLMPQVGPFSTIKWARFRLTKTQRGLAT